jgi:hypothetical protein
MSIPNHVQQISLPMTPWRRLQVDDPAVRAIKALEHYISIWRKGCTPPDSVAWSKWHR